MTGRGNNMNGSNRIWKASGRIAAAALFSLFFIMIISPAAFAPIDSPARFYIPSNETLSLGLRFLHTNASQPDVIKLVIEASNCSTIVGVTTCAPIQGVTVNGTITRPDSTNVSFSFTDEGNGNYTREFDYMNPGNYSLNITANRTGIGNNSIFLGANVRGNFGFHDNENISSFENRTVIDGFNTSFLMINSTIANFLASMNITFRDTGAFAIINLTLVANISREVYSLPTNVVFSPQTAGVIAKEFEKQNSRHIFAINESNASFTSQEVFFYLNGTIAQFNITLQQGVPRDLAFLSDSRFIASPLNASVLNISFNSSSRRLTFVGNGTGTQEVLVHVGNQSEPANITVDNTTILTGANWTFNNNTKLLTFNFTFSQHTFGVNFPIPSEGGGEEPAPGPSPGGGGGGGGGGTITPRPNVTQPKPEAELFGVEPTIIRVEIRQGESLRRLLNVKNMGESLSFEISHDLRNVLFISEDRFSLTQNREKNVNLDFFAAGEQEPGVFTGRVVVKAGGFSKVVGIIVEVKQKKSLFDAKLEILPEFREVRAGGTVFFKIELFNLGAFEKGDVRVKVFLRSPALNTSVELFEETFAVQTQLSVVRATNVPLTAEPGDYALVMYVSYDSQTAITSDLLEVFESAFGLELELYRNLLITSVIILGIVFGLALWHEHRHFGRYRRFVAYTRRPYGGIATRAEPRYQVTIRDMERLVEEKPRRRFKVSRRRKARKEPEKIPVYVEEEPYWIRDKK